MTKPTVLLLYGGESSEHEVSIMSARNVYEAIDTALFEVRLGYISRAGKWYALEKFEQYEQLEGAEELLPVLGAGRFVVGGETLTPDVLLPILHGKNGEDGSVQGLAQLLHIPVVGCDMTASAAGMDKVIAKHVAAQAGICVVPYVVHRRGDERPSYDDVVAQLSATLFVKPSRAGSSVGVSKVHNSEEFGVALDAALAVDSTVLIEQALDVRELEVAALGVPPSHEVSRVGEILPGAEFYSYDDKYDQASTSTTQIPAQLDDATEREVRDAARKFFAEIGGSGLARIDFFLANDGLVYFNEINTLPGFTNISMYPKLWQDAGVSYSELITRLIQHARGE